MSVKKLLAKTINIIFPVKCVCCKKISENSDGEDILCKSCREILIREAKRNCVKCNNPPELCKCKNNKIEHIDNIIFTYFYKGDKIRQAIYAIKRANLYYINEFFAKGMYNSLKFSDKINIDSIDIITNTPRKKDSVKFYGYNQTKVLAQMIAKYAGIKYMPVLEASKLYDTEQKSLSKSERNANVSNKFIPVKSIIKNKDNLTGKNVLIIDDIVTTGSTLSECARIMKNMGAEKVYALCAASVFS